MPCFKSVVVCEGGGGADTYIDDIKAYLNVIICIKQNLRFTNSRYRLRYFFERGPMFIKNT